MKAAWYERTGPAREVFKFGERPDPFPGPGQIRVRLHAAGVNPKDTKYRSGWAGLAQAEAGVTIPGDDGAGIVEQLGEGVDRGRHGQRVWIHGARLLGPRGTAAELVVVNADQAVPLLDSVSFADGASLGIPAMTAHRACFWDGPAAALAGRTVLVTGAAGCVGLFAVQLAKWAGASVIGTVSGAEKAAAAVRAGADHTINYRQEDVVARVKDLTKGAGVDRIIEVEFGGNLATSRAALARHGTIAAYGSDQVPSAAVPFYSADGLGMTLHFVAVSASPPAAKRAATADISAALASGALRSIVGAHYPMSQIAEAHDAVERGAVIGKVILDIAP